MVEVKAVKEWVYLFEREPDPAGGRAEERQLVRLTITQAESLIVQVQEALPAARAAELRRCEEALIHAQSELHAAGARTKLLRNQISRLQESKAAAEAAA